MNALEFVRKRNRMCRSFIGRCDDCPADKINCCDTFDWNEEIISIVDKWSKDNPRKTRQDLFLEQWPNAQFSNNVLKVCPEVIDNNFSCPLENNVGSNCPDCRRKFWLETLD